MNKSKNSLNDIDQLFVRVADMLRKKTHDIEVIHAVIKSDESDLYFITNIGGAEKATDEQKIFAVRLLNEHAEFLENLKNGREYGPCPLDDNHQLDLYAWSNADLPDFVSIKRQL